LLGNGTRDHGKYVVIINLCYNTEQVP
jgi:hypothetical protein